MTETASTTTEHDVFCDCQPCLNRLAANLQALNAGRPAPMLDDFEREAAEVVVLSAPFQPAQIAKAAELIDNGGIVRAGRIYLVTASDGVTRYEADAYRQTCTCMAGQHGRKCYHLAAACYLAAA